VADAAAEFKQDEGERATGKQLREALFFYVVIMNEGV